MGIFCGEKASKYGRFVCDREKCAQWYEPTGQCAKIALVVILNNLLKTLGERV